MIQEQVVQLYRSGLTIKQVATQLSRSETNIRRYLDLADEPRRSQEKPLPVSDEALQVLYESGLTLQQLADRFERPVAVIHRHVKHGTRKQGKPGPRKSTLYCKWCKQNFPRNEVSAQTCSECRPKLSWLKKLRGYGLTELDYWAWAQTQDYKCCICKRSPKDKLVVDHCHVSGRVRGLLCPQCNSGLGMFQDNPEVLKEALKYLEKCNE